MRVLHVITTLNPGGAEKLILDSIPIYQNKGIVCDVLVLNAGSSKFVDSLKSTTNGNVISLTKGTVYNPLLIFKIIPYLFKYDIIHAHLFPVLYWVIFAKIISFARTPIIYTEHNTNNRRRKINFFKLLDKFVYARLSYIGCITEATLINLSNHLNSSDYKMSVVLNGVNLSNFTRIDYKKIKLFDIKSFVLIQVSSFREQKDQPTLIRALALLPNHIKLILVGDGHLRIECEKLVNELGLQDRVEFLGNRLDIPALIHSSDVCVLSSHYEGFGLAILEGMACGKPSIASDVSGIREVLEGYGLLFEQGNFKELARHILNLSEDLNLYNKISNNCLQRSKDFDINNMTDEYIKLYNKLMLEK